MTKMTQEVILPMLNALVESEETNKQVGQLDELTIFLNNPPPEKWIKTNKFANNAKYVPIDKVEYLLKVLFKEWKVEVTGQGVIFNGAYVTIRLHYKHPITGEWSFHDGIGSEQITTAKGASPADLSNITNGALSQLMPKCKTAAIKDAAHMLGRIFGSDLNRPSEETLYEVTDIISHEELVALFELKETSIPANFYNNLKRIIDQKEIAIYNKTRDYLKTL